MTLKSCIDKMFFYFWLNYKLDLFQIRRHSILQVSLSSRLALTSNRYFVSFYHLSLKKFYAVKNVAGFHNLKLTGRVLDTRGPLYPSV